MQFYRQQHTWPLANEHMDVTCTEGWSVKTNAIDGITTFCFCMAANA